MGKFSLVATSVLTAVIISGCGGGTKSVATDPVEHKSVAPDPVEQLKQMALRYNGKKIPGLIEGGDRKLSQPLIPQDISYDVAKTDSLVSPYSGTIILKASYSEDPECLFVLEFTLTYAHQDGSWVWKGSNCILYWVGATAKRFGSKRQVVTCEFRPGMEK